MKWYEIVTIKQYFAELTIIPHADYYEFPKTKISLWQRLFFNLV